MQPEIPKIPAISEIQPKISEIRPVIAETLKSGVQASKE